MEHGQVRSFFSDQSRRFGFIRRGGGDECFFHMGDYRPLNVDRDGTISFREEGKAPRAPLQGDKIVFVVVQGSKGPKASPWTYASEHAAATKTAEAIIAANNVLYRVIERHDVDGQSGEDKAAFEGTLKDLERRFPRPLDRRADELATGSGSSDFERSVRFERQDGGAWTACDDPRTRLDDHAFRSAMRSRTR